MKKAEIKGYDAYKPSEVEWLGEIPTHWDVRRIKYLFVEINERSFNGEEDLLSVSQYTGVSKKSDEINDGDFITNANTLEGYKKVNENDLVVNIMLAWNGSLGFSSYDGITSPAYAVYRLGSSHKVRYFHYLLRTDLYKAEFKRNSSGVVESRLRLYTENFFGINAIIPPSSEQTAIARFLDSQTALIDKAIVIKEKQIALLKERRQAILHRVVTKGLNPNVPMKDSGIDWIGEIPAHWAMKRIKHVTSKIGSGITPTGGAASYVERGVPLLRSQNVTFGKIDFQDVVFISKETHKKMSNSQVKKGDVLLNITGGSIGRCHFVEQDDEINVNQHVCILRPKCNVFTGYLNGILASEVGQGQVWFYQQGGGREGLNFQAIKNFLMPLPPLSEQQEITVNLQLLNQKVDQLLVLKANEIEKLKEYRSTLINSAVTGKIKVT